MPVLTVAERFHLMARREDAPRKTVALFFHGGKHGWIARGSSVQLLRYGNIVSSCVFESLQRQRLPEFHLYGGRSFGLLKGFKERRITCGIGGDQDMLVIFR